MLGEGDGFLSFFFRHLAFAVKEYNRLVYVDFVSCNFAESGDQLSRGFLGLLFGPFCMWNLEQIVTFVPSL